MVRGLMLYKKVHRQFLRDFRVGRKFKTKYSVVCEITKGLHISREWIVVEVDDEDMWYIIKLFSGQIWDKNDMIWLED